MHVAVSVKKFLECYNVCDVFCYSTVDRLSMYFVEIHQSFDADMSVLINANNKGFSITLMLWH